MTGADHIAPPLRALALPIEDLTEDPGNARTHSRRNLDAIKSSLERFGQRQPIIARRDGLVVIAGNGRLRAARELGWSELAVVLVDDSESTGAAYALADNRTAELAAWDTDALAASLDSIDDVTGLGWTPAELARILHDDGPEPADDDEDGEGEPLDTRKIATCPECLHRFDVSR